MARLPPDGCVVPTDPLAALVRDFLDDWNRDRPQTAGRFAVGGGTAELGPVRAAEWLSDEAGVSESTIQNIVDRRYRMTELRVADALVTALEMPWVFCDGGAQGEPPPTLPVYPNPSASPAARAECCGGSGDAASLTGVA